MLFRGSVGLAALGLAFNVMLWSLPALVGGAALPHALFPNSAPRASEALTAAERSAGPRPGLFDALTQLIGAEVEALEVAGLGLQQPTPPELAPRANHAGARVMEAISTYIRSAAAVLDKSPHL
jgi:hypothetical protein